MAFSEQDIEPFIAFEKNGWENAAKAYHDHWGLLSAQSALPMLKMAKVTAGTRLLDVASGAGYVAATAFDLGATPIGLDFSRAQVELARKVYPDIEFTEGDAQSLPFDDQTFDAVVMGFGMNHLSAPEKAAKEAWRVLKPGGAFAFSVWSAPSPGEAFGIVLSAIEAFGVPDAKLPSAPPYFRFADRIEVLSLLGQEGFEEISTVIAPQHWRHKTADEVFNAFNDGAVRATAMLKAQPKDVREKIKDAVRSEVSKLAQDDEYVVPVPASVSVGFKAQ